jgi:hypothetical protein
LNRKYDRRKVSMPAVSDESMGKIDYSVMEEDFPSLSSSSSSSSSSLPSSPRPEERMTIYDGRDNAESKVKTLSFAEAASMSSPHRMETTGRVQVWKHRRSYSS